MGMLLATVLLAAGLVLLIKGADIFVDGAARIARGMQIPPMAIGLTVVAFGTSVPELFVNIAAAVSADTGIALGNVVGSNSANILLVLGIAALIRPLSLPRATVWRGIPFCLLAAVVMWIMAADEPIDGAFFACISRSDGLLLLGYFAVFLAYAASFAAPLDGLPRIVPALPGTVGSVALKMAAGFCGLLFGGRMIVEGGAGLATLMGVPQRVVGLTVVAVGTSLPELATSILAARRGEVELALGNVVGSNIFNIFFILGVSAVIRPLPFNPAAHVDMSVMTAATVLLFVFMFTGRQRVMHRWEGALALLMYAGYLTYLIVSAG